MNAPTTPPIGSGDPHTGAVPHYIPEPEAPESNPIAGLFRLMRGRWLTWAILCVLLAPTFAAIGFLNGVKTFESQAILRIYPKEASVLYSAGDDTVLKTYQSFVKAETTFVAGHPVMSRALEALKVDFPDQAADAKVSDLAGSIEIKRSESLIVLKTKSKDPAFAAAKLEAVTTAYLGLTNERNTRQQTMRTQTLVQREADLMAELAEINTRLLQVGGEFGIIAISKAHIEKIAQIDATAARKGEVEATLLALEQSKGASSADMNDEEIMRATLLDRALADLNFEKVRHQATLATYLQLYQENARQVRDIRKKIIVIEQAMEDRRTQIQVLGQTGALTDQSAAGEDDSVAALQDLLEKVTKRLEDQRAEARDLNARRVELEFLESERAELYRMLKDTRNALDVIRVESSDALPGLIDLMAPPVVPEKPAKDGSKLFAAGGLGGGVLVATLLVLISGLSNTRLRHSDDLWSVTHALPILGLLTTQNGREPRQVAREMDRMRNRIQLLPARMPFSDDRGRIIAVTRLAPGPSHGVALGLAHSFSRTGTRTLLIDADAACGALTRELALTDRDGWLDRLVGHDVTPVEQGALSILPRGHADRLGDGDVALPVLRRALRAAANDYDVIVVEAGSLEETVSGELLLSCADLAIGVTGRRDRRDQVLRNAQTLIDRPRNGGGLWFADALETDPSIEASR